MHGCSSMLAFAALYTLLVVYIPAAAHTCVSHAGCSGPAASEAAAAERSASSYACVVQV